MHGTLIVSVVAGVLGQSGDRRLPHGRTAHAALPVLITLSALTLPLGAQTTDTTPPSLVSAVVENSGDQITLTFDEIVQSGGSGRPRPSAFSVTVDGEPVSVDVPHRFRNSQGLALTAHPAIARDQAVAVSYSDPSSGDDSSAIQDLAGNDAASFTTTAVNNSSAIADTTPPSLVSAVVEDSGFGITLTFDEDLGPTAVDLFSIGVVFDAVSVTADGEPVQLESLTTGPTTLDFDVSLITRGQTVVVSYTDPSPGDDESAIQDKWGNDAASFTATATNRSTVPGSLTVPDAPTGLTLTGADGGLTASWADPANDGGSPITFYRVQWRSGDEDWDPARAAISGRAWYDITGLTNGVSYTVRVAAENALGTGAWSDEATGMSGTTGPQGGVESDRAVLEALYHATDGPNWRDSTNWLTDAPLGEWSGVETSADGRVRELLLADNDLSGEIPDAIGNLAELEYLGLYANRLRGSIPDIIGNLVNLRVLALGAFFGEGDNQLSGPIPDGLGNLTNLRHLSLDNNALRGPIPDALGNLVNLDYLNLDNNALRGSIPAALGNLRDLRYLNLANNELSGPIPDGLGDLTDLGLVPLTSFVGGGVLDLANNQLSGPIPAALGNLVNLPILNLSGNRLSGQIPAALGNLVDLRQLDLDNDTGLCLALDFPLDSAFARLAQQAGVSICEDPSLTVPDAPTGLTLTAADGALAASWAAPANDGGSAVTGYRVQWRSGDEDWDPATREASVTGTSHEITGLTNGVTYIVRLAAVNEAGTGAWSAEATAAPAQPVTVPDAPTGLTLTAADGALAASWAAPANDGGSAVTGYRVQWRSGDEDWDPATREASVTGTSHEITGLTNGVTYTVRLAAVNEAGTGAWSAEATAAPAQPVTVPDAPTGLTLTAADGALAASWAAPANDGGSAVTGYRVQWRSGGEDWDSATREATSATTSYDITGLTNGATYTVRVAAVNAQGTGAWSDEATGMPGTPVPALPGVAVALLALLLSAGGATMQRLRS